MTEVGGVSCCKYAALVELQLWVCNNSRDGLSESCCVYITRVGGTDSVFPPTRVILEPFC